MVNNLKTSDYIEFPESDTAVIDKVEHKTKPEKSWKVILYNSDHYFEEVIFQLQKATSCSIEVAVHIAMEAHNSGKAIAFIGEKSKCERVANVLKQIMLIVTLESDE
ncbi:MAG: ATP-dependent Clp protease adaptor ClpS [Planctomycetes bacterium]|nr:ATP-dependent Clp protease adaptor ClpS [Planctomycetota bacterium]